MENVVISFKVEYSYLYDLERYELITILNHLIPSKDRLYEITTHRYPTNLNKSELVYCILKYYDEVVN